MSAFLVFLLSFVLSRAQRVQIATRRKTASRHSFASLLLSMQMPNSNFLTLDHLGEPPMLRNMRLHPVKRSIASGQHVLPRRRVSSPPRLEDKAAEMEIYYKLLEEACRPQGIPNPVSGSGYRRETPPYPDVIDDGDKQHERVRDSPSCMWTSWSYPDNSTGERPSFAKPNDWTAMSQYSAEEKAVFWADTERWKNEQLDIQAYGDCMFSPSNLKNLIFEQEIGSFVNLFAPSGPAPSKYQMPIYLKDYEALRARCDELSMSTTLSLEERITASKHKRALLELSPFLEKVGRSGIDTFTQRHAAQRGYTVEERENYEDRGKSHPYPPYKMIESDNRVERLVDSVNMSVPWKLLNNAAVESAVKFVDAHKPPKAKE